MNTTKLRVGDTVQISSPHAFCSGGPERITAITKRFVFTKGGKYHKGNGWAAQPPWDYYIDYVIHKKQKIHYENIKHNDTKTTSA